MNLQPPLCPKDGRKIKVLIAVRVSDPRPGKQDERSIDDQKQLLLRWLTDIIGENFDVVFLEGRESGEWLEREDYLKLIQLVETGLYDLVLTEDIGRIIRRIHAHLFAELCVENGTRLISLNDHIDSAIAGWEDRSIFSAWHHERSNRDTSDRIKRAHRNRFDNGGCAQFVIYGYIKPEGSKSDSDWRKDPSAEPIYREWFRKLDEDQASYAEIADWLNAQNVPTGRHSRSKRWTSAMVGRVTHNTLLKGVRHRNKRKSQRNCKGRYVSIKAPPQELRTRHVPHLAFFEEAYYDRVVADADARNSSCRRKLVNGVDPRARAPKKRTRWPGQHLFCGVCGGMLLYGAHGQMDHLVCGRARDYRCWMGVSVDGALARRKLLDALGKMLNDVPEFDPEILSVLQAEAVDIGLQARTNLQALDRELQRLTAAQRAAKLQRLMDERGLTSAYEELSMPPAEGKKLKRHLHPRFKQHSQGDDEVPGAA